MRLVSWNLGHQTRESPLGEALAPALRALAPDVVVLNEFVDGSTRDSLRSLLRSLGLDHIHCSRRIGRHNQVLVSSREECTPGELTGPSLEGGAGESNFLHVRFSSGMDLIGVRAPTYKRQERTDYWEQLTALIRSTSERPVVWIGDWNADPDNRRSFGGKYLSGLEREGWSLRRPEGSWSFCRGSRIDHILTSKAVNCFHAEYVTAVNGADVAGGGPANGYVSDHAALIASVELRSGYEP